MKQRIFVTAIIAAVGLIAFQNCGEFRANVAVNEVTGASVKPPPPGVPNPPPPPPLSDPPSAFKLVSPNPGSATFKSVEFRGACDPGSKLAFAEGTTVLAADQSCSSGQFLFPANLTTALGTKNLKVTQTLAGKPDQTLQANVSVVAECTIASSTVVTPAVATLVAANMPEKSVTGAIADDGSWRLDYHGAVSQDVSFPVTGYYAFRTTARGTSVAGGAPKMQIAIDGQMVSEHNVASATSIPYLSETAATREIFPITAGVHKVSVGFSNWAHVFGTNNYQNLYVKNIAIHRATAVCPSSTAPVDLSAKTLSGLAAARGLRIGTEVYTIGNTWNTDAAYKPILAKHFSHINPGQAFIMSEIATAEGVMNFAVTDQLVAYAEQNKMTLTVSHLVWHRFIPQWFINKNPTAQQTRDFMRAYITAVMTRYKGRIKYYVVVNEALSDVDGEVYRTDSLWYQKLGPGFLKEAVQFARAADPNAVLIYNDYNVEELGRKSDNMLTLLATLKSGGAPVDVVGLQAHLRIERPFLLESYVANMRRLAALGYKIHISEVDAAMDLPVSSVKLNIQAQLYRRVVKGCLAVPQCENVTTWGITDKYFWLNSATVGSGLLFNDLYAPKPAYSAVMNALYGLDP